MKKREKGENIMLQIETSRGNIFYTEYLIKNIVALSTISCSGVVGIANRNIKEGNVEITKNNISNGVKIKFNENRLNVDIYVILKYGIKVATIANEIIQKVKYDIENYTGIFINCITVNIQGISF